MRIVLMMTILLLFGLTAAAQSPPSSLRAGSFLKHGDHAAFAVGVGGNVSLSTVYGEDSTVVSQTITRFSYFKTEDVTAPDYVNDLQAMMTSLLWRRHIGHGFALATGVTAAFQPKDGEDETDFPVLLEISFAPISGMEIVLGAEYWAIKNVGDVVYPYLGLSLSPP